MEEKIVIFLNPSSGSGIALKNKEKIESLLRKYKVKYDLFISRSEKHLIELVRDNQGKYETIVGIGGDTTFNIIVNQIIEGKTRSRFSMISLGSSNDIAREFGVESLESACRAIRDGKTEEIDIVRVSCDSRTSYFIGTATLGLGVFVNRFVENLKKKKSLLAKVQPVAGFLGVRKSFKEELIPYRAELSYDDQKYSVKRFSLIVFNNTPYYATGLVPSPQADATDGLLDCCIIDANNFFEFFKVAYLTYRKNYSKRKNVEILKAKRFIVSSEKGIEIQIDGEIMGCYRRIELEIKHKALAILVNK
jgi:diacylglycerol kinase (ATP)